MVINLKMLFNHFTNSQPFRFRAYRNAFDYGSLVHINDGNIRCIGVAYIRKFPVSRRISDMRSSSYGNGIDNVKLMGVNHGDSTIFVVGHINPLAISCDGQLIGFFP